MRLPGLRTLLVTTAIVVTAAVSIGGGATFVALEATTRPEFCRSCHIMEPYYDSWASSSHKNVSCVECHYEPGLLETFEGKFKALSQLAKYVTSTEGSKPWAEVSDYSCMRSGCHSTRLLEGEIRFGRIRFDHRDHLIGLRRGEKLRCTSCHSQIVQGNHLTVTPTTCYLCHFKSDGKTKPNDDCNTCHGAPSGTIALEGGFDFEHAAYLERGVECKSCHGDITRGAGDVPPERCGSCHNQQEHLQRIGDVEFMHRNHVTDHSVTCLDCHLEIQHGLPSREQHGQGRCEDCHAGTHAEGSALYRGTGGHGVPDRPGVMYLARVTCSGCHRPPFADTPLPPGGATFAADPLACIDCHGTGFDGMVERWQSEVRGTVASVRAGVEALHQELGAAAQVTVDASADAPVDTPADAPASAPASAPAEARQRYEQAAFNLSVVLLDGSDGAHNLPYARDLLGQAAADVSAGFAALKGKRPPEMHVGPAVLSEAGCTNLCHTTPETLAVPEARGLPFDHGAHVADAKLECATCHRVDVPAGSARGGPAQAGLAHGGAAHGATRLARADCAACHHANEDVETCGACHTAEAALHARTVEGLDAVPMADVDCLGCHITLEPGHEREAARSSCNLCHAGEGIDAKASIAAAAAPLDALEGRLAAASPELAARLRADIAALRAAGPFHNAAGVKAEAERLTRLLEPAAPPASAAPAPAVPAPAVPAPAVPAPAAPAPTAPEKPRGDSR